MSSHRSIAPILQLSVSLVALALAASTALSQSIGGSFTATGSMTAARYSHSATLLGNGKILIVGGVTLASPTNTAELFDPISGTSKALPSMSLPRYYHTATLLPNGKVLIAGGGVDYDNGTDKAELFDPATETFTELANPMTSVRWGHTATLLSNGKVLLASGSNGVGVVNTAELFDPVSETFTLLANTMTSPRFAGTATRLQNGKILFAGGTRPIVGAQDTAELFDPVSMTFTALSNVMTSKRELHTATALADGRVLIVGGSDGNGTTHTAEIFDPVAETFTAIQQTAVDRYSHSATLLPNGKVLIAGGGYVNATNTNLVELFDPVTGTFSVLTSMLSSARLYATATLLPTGRVLLAGGHTGRGNSNTAEIYDSSAAGNFTSLPNNMTLARFFPTATLLPNEKVLIAGGEPGTGPSNTAELFDPATGTFTLEPNTMAVGRFRHTATLLRNGKVLIAGGDTSSTGTGATDKAELFDPATGMFTSLPSMTSPRFSHTATLLPNGKVLITGGVSTSDFVVTNTAELFDPVAGTFTTLPSMNSARDFHTATLLASGKVLIAGGFSPATGGYNTAELFDPASGTFTVVANTMTTKRYYHSATLLPSGKVLLAGGGGSAPPVFSGSVITNTAELFDPISGTFTQVPATMNSYRYWQTATLLPSGNVLLADGSTADYAGAAYTRTAELFDPVTGTFTLLPLMNSVRFGHTATLLPSGEVLLAAGTTGSTATNTAEIFDENVGFAESRRPVVAGASLTQGGSLVLTGTGFRGDSEAGGSCNSDSATNYPILQLTRVDNEQTFFVLSDPATSWSDTSFASETLGATTMLPSGHYRATIFTNAIPSFQKIINITVPPVQLLRVVSRKTHGSAGTFDLDLPLAGNPGIECRSGGASGDYTLVFSFANPLTSVGGANLTSGTGTVSSRATDTGDAHNYVVNLTGITNARIISIRLTDVNDIAGNFSPAVAGSMGVLIADVNANGVVTNTDAALVKGQVAAPVTASNFRDDVNANGVISNTDVSSTKALVGTSLP